MKGGWLKLGAAKEEHLVALTCLTSGLPAVECHFVPTVCVSLSVSLCVFVSVKHTGLWQSVAGTRKQDFSKAANWQQSADSCLGL